MPQRYNLIASAIAGRNVTVHWHSSEKYHAYTDGQSIFLPAARKHEGAALTVMAQAVLLRSNSLHSQWLRRIVGKRQLSERYLYAEVCRASRRHQGLLPRLFCEQPALQQFPHRPESSEDSYRLAVNNAAFPTTPEFIGSLRPFLILKNRISDQSFSGLSKKQQQGEMQFRPVDELADDDQEDAEESKLLKLFQNPLMSGGAVGDMLNKILGAGRSGKAEEDGSGGGSEVPIASIQKSRKKGVFASLTQLALDLVDDQQSDDIGSYCYPEWHFAKQCYRPDWCRVDEMDPWRDDALFDETAARSALATLLTPPSLHLKRQLSGIGLSYEVHRKQQDGDDYSLDSLIDYTIDQQMGVTPDERLFECQLKTRRDLAVMILLDISGSTAEQNAEGQSIHQQQTQLAHQLLQTLHELGDQVALYAFHSWGKSLVRLLRIKSFKEQRIGNAVYERLARLEPVGYTRTGAALRHANHKLSAETGLPYRLLIVITDGFAYDQDYEGKYGEEDTRKALEEVRKAGTGCLCLTIGSEQDNQKLASIYGPASTLAANDQPTLEQNLRPAVLKAIRQIKA